MTLRTAPTIEVGHGHAQAEDGRAAGRQAARDATATLRAHRPSLVLVFSSARHDPAEVVSGVREVTGDAPLVGASTLSEIDGVELRGSVVVAVWASPELAVSVGAGSAVADDWKGALDTALAAPGVPAYFGGPQRWLEAGRAGRSAFALLFTPGSTQAARSRSRDLLESLSRRAVGRLPVFEGPASGCGGESWILAGDRAIRDGVAVAVVETSLQFGIAGAQETAGAGVGALREAILRGRVTEPAFVLATRCGLRPQLFPVEGPGEIDALARALADTPLVGLQSFGEQGPTGEGASCEGDATISVLALGREISREAQVARESEQLRREAEIRLGELAAALERVSRTEAQQRALLDSMTDFAWLKDPQGRFIAVSRSFAQLNGYAPEEMVGRTDHDMFEPERARSNRAEDDGVMASGEPFRLEQELAGGSGRKIWVEKIKVPFRDERGRVAGTAGVARDITHRRELERLRLRNQEDLEQIVRERTAMLASLAEDLESRLEQLRQAERERRKLEEQVRQAQKMEAVGRLAGGVAHDFNNILTVILGSAKDLHRRTAGDAEGRALADEVLDAAKRAAALTRQLLAFSRQQALRPREIDVNEIVNGLEKMLRRLIGADIEIVTKLGRGLGLVLADPGQIEQVVMNLVVNARDAMPRGGRLTIETREVEEAPDDVSGGRPAPGPHIVLAVTDTGHGMDPTVMEHVFEPFFTTKERGKGTGLGLATVFGIVKQSGGGIAVRSEPGAGTAFTVYLPRAADAPAPRRAARADREATRGQETVLLVEDDPAVRGFMRRSLETAGFAVLEAARPEEALRLARTGISIDILLTDVVMPAMAGPELAAALLSDRQDLRVLFVSGYTEDAGLRSGSLPPGQAFLQKPFTGDELAQAVRDTLELPLVRRSS